MKFTASVVVFATVLFVGDIQPFLATSGTDSESVEPRHDSTWIFLLGDATLLLRQELLDDSVLTELSLLGHGWLAFGFNQDGRMIGSTVVIGFPDQPLVPGKNPGQYYLASRNSASFDRVDNDGNRIPDSNLDGNDAFDDPRDEWQRQLNVYEEGSREAQRRLQLTNASLVQNETHTVLHFVRPLVWQYTDKDVNGTIPVNVHPDGLNTYIWAAGSDNQFGFHGDRRGSGTIDFSATYGTFVPTSSPI